MAEGRDGVAVLPPPPANGNASGDRPVGEFAGVGGEAANPGGSGESSAGSTSLCAGDDLTSPVQTTNAGLTSQLLLTHEKAQRREVSCRLNGQGLALPELEELEHRLAVRQWTFACEHPARDERSPIPSRCVSPTLTDVPELSDDAANNQRWLEATDKQRYMHAAPPAELGFIHCKVAVASDRRMVMKLASNDAFLAHGWYLRKGMACCGGGSEGCVISRGPEEVADPQCFVFEMETSASVCRAARYAEVECEALVATKDCICFCMPCGATAEPKTAPPGQLASAAANPKAVCCAEGGAGVIRALRLPLPPPPGKTAPDFTGVLALSPKHTQPGAGETSIFAFPKDEPILAVTLYQSARGRGAPPASADLSFKHPLTGYQAFAAYMAWTSLAR